MVNIVPSQRRVILPDRVVDLTAKHLRSSDANYVSALLRDASMPKLTTLIVNHKVPTPTSGDPFFLPPMFKLPSDQFPSLTSIKMSYAAIVFPPSLASQLHVLHIDSGIAKVPLGLSLSPFLECLWSFSCIEDLRLIRCFAPPTVNPSAPQGLLASARRPLNASQLQNLEIEDHPSNIGRIMTELNVPASALVTLSGTVHGASPKQCGWAIQAMLPHDRARLPMLCSIQAIVVSVISYRCEVNAYMREEDTRSQSHFLFLSGLRLRLLTDICDDKDHYLGPSPDARLSLFSTLLSGLKHMFMDTRGVTYLKIDAPGGFETIAEGAWVDTLARFPNLRHLVAHDEDFREYPKPLLNALCGPQGRSVARAQLLCPEIHSFELCAGEIDVMDSDSDNEHRPGVAQLNHIVACLESRRNNGGPSTLHLLTVEISSSVDVPKQLFARYRGEFKRLAQHYSLTENAEFKLLAEN